MQCTIFTISALEKYLCLKRLSTTILFAILPDSSCANSVLSSPTIDIKHTFVSLSVILNSFEHIFHAYKIITEDKRYISYCRYLSYPTRAIHKFTIIINKALVPDFRKSMKKKNGTKKESYGEG